jgi:hypothetical protein
METKLNDIILGLTPNQEFEGRFNYQQPSLSIDMFQLLLEKVKNTSLEYTISHSLDINYNDNFNAYRLIVHDLDNINNIIQNYGNKPNDIIFKLLISKYLKKAPKIDFIYKNKTEHKKQSFDDTEYNIRFRLSREDKISTKSAKEFLKSNFIDNSNISFRFKHRLGLNIVSNDSHNITLDLTSVKFETVLSKISTTSNKYEAELEIFKLDNSKIKKDTVELYTNWIKKVLSWMSKSTTFISKQEKDFILGTYKKLFGLNDSTIKLYSMQPVTLDLPRLTDSLANNYAVCDKADGEKYGLFILKGKVYYLSNNLEISFSGLENEKFPDVTYAEGELVDDRFMLFDIFFFNGADVRNNKLKERINILDKLISIINPNNFKFKEFDGTDFTLRKIILFYRNNLIDYVKYLNVNKSLIDRKYFLFPLGIDNREVFSYSLIIWNEIRKGPYMLDGLIFTGIEQKYTTIQQEIAFPILKWKPEELNSIDMYIEFEKNDKGEIENVYDNSNPDEQDRIFKIANLFVGSTKKNVETPVPFMKDQNLHQAYFYVDERLLVRDLQNKIVNDRTVVELTYKSDDSIPPEKRWEILRTRYDKTFSVQNYSRQYGNNEFIARKIFDTIINPIKFSDLELLATDYENNIKKFRQRVSTKIIEISKQDDAYYQFKTDIAQPMKKYHNFVKDILYVYLKPKRLYNSTKLNKLTVLDFGIGRGGDILKYYHIGIKEVVGIDPDVNGLFNSSDSANSRYETQRKKKPYFTKMTFIQASAGEILDLENQLKQFPLMSEDNKKYITTYLNSKKKYNCISAQFSIHYMFNKRNFNNLTQNINTYLNKDGYFLVTTFDALLVKEYLNGKEERSEYFTDETGTKRALFTIKNVSIKESEGLDQAIDFYTAIFMPEGRFETEYLVYPDFFIKEMKERCNLKLIESVRFKDLMELEKNFFMSSIEAEADIRRKKFLEEDVKKFYTGTGELHEASVKLSQLNRFYVFQK